MFTYIHQRIKSRKTSRFLHIYVNVLNPAKPFVCARAFVLKRAHTPKAHPHTHPEHFNTHPCSPTTAYYQQIVLPRLHPPVNLLQLLCPRRKAAAQSPMFVRAGRCKGSFWRGCAHVHTFPHAHVRARIHKYAHTNTNHTHGR